jgi:hypothetical protein
MSLNADLSEGGNDVPSEIKTQILTNMSDDLAVCSAFYQIVSECVNNTEPGKGEGFEKASLSAAQKAALLLTLSNQDTLVAAGKEVDGKEVAEKSAQTVHLWYERYLKSMGDEMLTCANISLLLDKHLDPCGEYMNDLETLREKWTKELVHPE